MKKILSLVLALLIMLAMAAPTIAAEDDTSASGSSEGDHDIGVNGTYVPPTGGDKICIDIAWTGMSFEYNAEKLVWDDTTHTYPYGAAGRSTNKGSIEVVNHSNVAVTASFTFTKDASLEANVLGTFYSNNNGTYKRTCERRAEYQPCKRPRHDQKRYRSHARYLTEGKHLLRHQRRRHHREYNPWRHHGADN